MIAKLNILFLSLFLIGSAKAQRPAVQQESHSYSYSRSGTPMANNKALIIAGSLCLASGGGFIYGATALSKIDRDNGGNTDHGVGILCFGIGAAMLLIPGVVCTPIGIALSVKHKRYRIRSELNLVNRQNGIGLAYNF